MEIVIVITGTHEIRVSNKMLGEVFMMKKF